MYENNSFSRYHSILAEDQIDGLLEALDDNRLGILANAYIQGDSILHELFDNWELNDPKHPANVFFVNRLVAQKLAVEDPYISLLRYDSATNSYVVESPMYVYRISGNFLAGMPNVSVAGLEIKRKQKEHVPKWHRLRRITEKVLGIYKRKHEMLEAPEWEEKGGETSITNIYSKFVIKELIYARSFFARGRSYEGLQDAFGYSEAR